MLIRQFLGYFDGLDNTKVPQGGLVFPSQNCEVVKGSVSSVLGIRDKFTIPDSDTPIHSSYTFASLVNEIGIRCFSNTLQIKLNSQADYVTFLTTLSGERVFFTQWTDTNTVPEKIRLVFADNSNNLYSWTGANGFIKTITGNQITVTGDKDIDQLGFDKPKTLGTVSLYVYRNGQKINTITYNNDITTQNFFVVNSSTGLAIGDLLIQAPSIFTNVSAVANTIPQVPFSYKNHLFLFNENTLYCPYSDDVTFDLDTGFNFTIPPPANATQSDANYLALTKNFTAVGTRRGTLVISDSDSWYKLAFTSVVQADKTYITFDFFFAGFNKGAKFMALSQYDIDIVYLGQDDRVYSFTLNQLGTLDLIPVLSDDIENFLFNRGVDTSICNIYFIGRNLYFLFPKSSLYIVFDYIEKHWQPPRYLGIYSLNVFGGTLYGHSNSGVRTFQMNIGDKDNAIKIITKIYTGFLSLVDKLQDIQTLTLTRNIIRFISAINNNITTISSFDTDFRPEIVTNTFVFSEANNRNILNADPDSFGSNPLGSEIFGGYSGEFSTLTRGLLYDLVTSSPSTFFTFQYGLECDDYIKLLEYGNNMGTANDDENNPELWIVKTP